MYNTENYEYYTYNLSHAVQISNLCYSSSANSDPTTIAWSPCNSELQGIMTKVSGALLKNETCFKDAKTMENALYTDSSKFYCGVQFDDSLSNAKTLDKNIHVTIR